MTTTTTNDTGNGGDDRNNTPVSQSTTHGAASAPTSPPRPVEVSPSSSFSLLSSTLQTKMTSLAPLISGAAGGTISTVLLLPLDNIKVRLQVNEGSSSSNSSSKTSAGHTNISASSISATHQHPSPPPQRQKQRLGSIAVLRGIVRHEGVRGLYQGLVPSVIGNGTSWGGFFFIYETLKLQLRQHKQHQQRQRGIDDGGVNETLVADNDKSTLPTLNSWENFQVATASGMALVFMTNPIWLVKLRMQLQMKHASEQLKKMSVSSSSPLSSTITETATTKKANITQYNGFIDAIKTIVREEGFWALYKGTGPALLLTSHGGVQFVVYEFLRKHFHFARATATASQDQQRKQQQHHQQQQDTNKNNDRNRHTTTTSVWYRFENSLGYLTMGAVSKMIASTVTYPLQVVKSRMQQPSTLVELTSSGDVRVVEGRSYVGLISTVRKIWTHEGVAGFFKGAIPNAVRVAPSAAVTFVVYEAVMDLLSVPSSS